MVLNGQRLQQPTDMPDKLFAIVSSCWSQDPNDRPSFLHLKAMLERHEGDDDDDGDGAWVGTAVGGGGGEDEFPDVQPGDHTYVELKHRESASTLAAGSRKVCCCDVM